MLPESLVLLACLSGGCGETVAAYKAYKPEMILIEQNVQRLAKPYFVDYWVPFVAFSMGKQAVIKLDSHFNMRLSQNDTGLAYNYQF